MLLQAALTVLGSWRSFGSPPWLAVTFARAAAAGGLALLMRPTAQVRMALIGYEVVAVAAGVAGLLAGHYVLGSVVGCYLLVGTVRTPLAEFTRYGGDAAPGTLAGHWAEPERDPATAPWAQSAPQPFPAHAPNHPLVGQPAPSPLMPPPALPPQTVPAQHAPAPVAQPAGVYDPAVATLATPWAPPGTPQPLAPPPPPPPSASPFSAGAPSVPGSQMPQSSPRSPSVPMAPPASMAPPPVAAVEPPAPAPVVPEEPRTGFQPQPVACMTILPS